MIAIDQYGEGALEGVLYHGDQQTGAYFTGYYGLVWQLEQYFSQMKYPRQVMSRRELWTSKNDEELRSNAVEKIRREGRIGTYTLRVTQRQNASWQGILTNEAGDVYRFSSFFNLVKHMEADLSQGQKEILDIPDRESSQQQMEQYLQVVMNCPEVMKILPDTLAYRFRKNGRSRTFMIRPMFYENDTCQGTIYWKECRKQSSFRSFLELVHMMGTAVWDGSDWSEQEEAI